jgi:hypothetical protein
MREAFVFETLDKHRNRLLKLVEGCPDTKRNTVPEHYNNSIHWQIGHVLTLTERLIFGLTEHALVLPTHYNNFFNSGTKPADWNEQPPAWDILIAQLKEQPVRIRELFQNKLELPVKENFLKAETVGELILASILHEAGHIGNISAMLKLLQS